MAKYIDAENLARRIKGAAQQQPGLEGVCPEVLEYINSWLIAEPEADVRENLRGTWVYDPDGTDWGLGAWACSRCGGTNSMIPVFINMPPGKEPVTHEKIDPLAFAGSSFCPHCGADMRKH